ncbi:LOW QUALITY PROTEIN: meiosis-specific nuclear structural protein 1-like [Salvelinus alpinus]
MKSEHERASVEQEKQDHKRYEEVVQYQQELEQQLEEKEHKRQEAYEEFLKEKLMVDEIIRQIYEEDQMERQLRQEKITATQRYMEFKSQQTEWRLMEREKMEAKSRRILEFAGYQQLRRRAEWRNSLRLKWRGSSRQMMMAKFAEDDRIEQMNAQKLRMKQLEHKRAVEKLLEDRSQQYLADKEREAEERAMEQKRETLRRQIIEEESRLLKLHATKLLGYLPKGIFWEDDLEHFDEDFRSNFQKRQADIFDEEGWGDDE